MQENETQQRVEVGVEKILHAGWVVFSTREVEEQSNLVIKITRHPFKFNPFIDVHGELIFMFDAEQCLIKSDLEEGKQVALPYDRYFMIGGPVLELLKPYLDSLQVTQG